MLSDLFEKHHRHRKKKDLHPAALRRIIALKNGEGFMLKQLIVHRRALHRIPELDDQLPKTQAYLLSQLEGLRCRIITPGRSAVLAYFDVGNRIPPLFAATWMLCLLRSRPAFPSARSTRAGCMPAVTTGIWPCFCVWPNGSTGIWISCPAMCCWSFSRRRRPPEALGIFAKPVFFEQLNVRHIFWHPPLAGFACRDHWLPQRANDGPFQRDDGRNHRQSAHIAKWQEGVDALAAGVEFVRQTYAMADSELPPEWFRVFKFGHMQSGTVRNAVSAHTLLEGTLRTFQDEAFDHITRRAAEIGQALQEKTGCQISVRFSEGYPPVYNDPALYDRAVRLLGPDGFVPLQKPALIAEDFSFLPAGTARFVLFPGRRWGTTRFTLPAFSLTKRCWNGEWRCIKRFCNFDFHQLST